MTVWEVFKKQVPCSLTPNGEWIAQNTHACTYAVWRHMHVAYAGYFIVCIVCWSTTRSLSWQAPYTQSTQNATDGCYPLLNSPHYQKIPRVLNNMATAYWIIKISLPCAAREQRALSLLLHRMPKSVHRICIGVVLYLNFGLGPGSFPVIGQVRKQLLRLRHVSLAMLVPLKSQPPLLCTLPTNTTGKSKSRSL